jgi:hypothetical protein
MNERPHRIGGPYLKIEKHTALKRHIISVLTPLLADNGQNRKKKSSISILDKCQKKNFKSL